MCADDVTFFQTIIKNMLFSTASKELENINQCLVSN